MLTPDLVYKRDVLRRRLGTELGDRAFREWLERSLAAVTPEPAEERAVAEAKSPAVVCHDAGKMTDNDACVSQVSDKPVANGERPGPAIRPTTQRERLTRRWTAEEVGTLYRLHGEGLAPQAIADRLGRTKRSVIGCAGRHDLKFGRRAKEPEVERSVMRTVHGLADKSPPVETGAGAVAAEPEPEAPDFDPAPCAACNGHDAVENGHDTHSEAGDVETPEPEPGPHKGCLWMDGEPDAPTWCGAPRSPGRPYCIDHCERAYVTSQGKRFPRSHFERPPEPIPLRRTRAA